MNTKIFWMTPPTAQRRSVPTVLEVLQEYSTASTLHGVRYIGQQNVGGMNRVGMTTENFWARPLTAKRKSVPAVLEVLQEYSVASTLHGVRYIGQQNVNRMTRPSILPLNTRTAFKISMVHSLLFFSAFTVLRIVWAIIVLVCLVSAGVLVYFSWLSFVNSPVLTTVENTHYPLNKFPFPAVTVCPADRIKRVVGEELLARYINQTLTEELRSNLSQILAALSIGQQPYYHRMAAFLEKVPDLLPKLEGLNISHFMLQVLPTCKEVFKDCYYQGKSIDCCKAFSIQRFEGGFCYSFNSFTSENRWNCPMGTGVLENGMAGPAKADDPCSIRRNTAAGTTTGLELVIEHHNTTNQLLFGQRDRSGIRVQVHHPLQFPEAGKDLFAHDLVNDSVFQFLTIPVAASASLSSDAVRNLDIQERNCYFPDENELDLYHTYTQATCLIECRMKYIIEQCNCRPFFFNIKNIPECSVAKLKCVADLGIQLRFFGSEDARIDCSECLPTCHEIVYDFQAILTEDLYMAQLGVSNYIDIHYKELGAVKYSRDVAIGKMQLVVNFGGIVGLFLGFSLLSGVELLYYFYKLLRVMIRYSRTPSKSSLIPRPFSLRRHL